MADFKRIIQRTTNSERVETGVADLQPNEICIVEDGEELIYKDRNGNIISVSKDKYKVGTIEELKNSRKYKIGDVVQVLGYYAAGDGAEHPRQKKPVGYVGTDAVIGTDGSIWGIVHSGTVDVSWLGAKGDGITDDTTAIQKALDLQNSKTIVFEHKTYVVSQTIIARREKNIDGKRATFLAKAEIWQDIVIGTSINARTILYVEARQPIWESELDQKSTFIRDFRILSNNVNHGFKGMYLGTYDNTVITQPSSVNYSVSGYVFDNISFVKTYTAIELSEVWDCNFNNLNSSGVKLGVVIHGQSVNNVFNSCKMYASDNALHVNSKVYNGEIRRPEGISFNGGFYGSATVGINFRAGLAFYFNGCIIDLNSTHAILGVDFSDVVFNECYIFNNSQVESVYIEDISTKNNNTCLKLVNSHIISNSGSIRVGLNQNGIITDNCQIKGTITVSNGGHIIAKDNVFYSGGMNILEGGDYTSVNNILKTTQQPISINRGSKAIYKIANTTDVMALKINGRDFNRRITDANEINDMSAFSIGAGSTPTHGLAGAGVYTNYRYDENFGVQMCMLANGNVYIRMENGGIWNSWSTLYNSATQTLNTPYYATKMQQEGVYEDFIRYMDAKVEYDKIQLEQVNSEIMTLKILEEPVPSEKLSAFITKYLG